MAVARVDQVVILLHKSEKDSFLEELQKASIVHVSDLRSDASIEEVRELLSPEERDEGELEALLSRLKRSHGFLKPYIPKKGFLAGLFGGKIELTRNEYFEIVDSFPMDEFLESTEGMERELSALKVEENSLLNRLEGLLPWKELDMNVEELGHSQEVVVVAGTVPIEKLDSLRELPLEYVEVNRDAKKSYLLLVFRVKDEEEIRRELLALEFEEADFEGLSGKPSEIIEGLRERLSEIDQRRNEIAAKAKELAKDAYKLLVLYDYYAGILEKYRAENRAAATEEAVVIKGWVRRSDWDRLEKLASSYETVYVTRSEPQPGEVPPVDLANRKAFKPFEMLTRLYGLPNYAEVDPTPLFAPFFAFFFGLCLTDAAYGIVLLILGFILMKKMHGGKDFLWILVAGAFFTVLAGAMTGSWFGDLPERLPIPFFRNLRNSLMLFDPMKEPMKFFYLSLALGYIQLLFGLLVGFYNKLRFGDTLGGISNELAWFVVLLSAGLLAFANLKAGKGGSFLFGGPLQTIATLLIFAGVFLIVFFSGGKSRNPVIRILKGLYNLYGGINFVGDLLSYVRLMALGMVTAGIAMAVNITAGLVMGFPVVGYVLAGLVFVLGHIFSIAVNALGGFVHSLRLQYVEFFTKFYENGGKPFTPLAKRAYFTVFLDEESGS